MRRLLRRETYAGVFDRLAFRLLLLLTVALLPLGAIAVHTTAETIRSAVWRSERALIGLTNDAVAGPRSLIESALAAGQALGPLAIERRGDLEECGALMSDYIQRSGVFAFAGFIDLDGEMRCNSHGEPVGDILDTDFERLAREERPVVVFSQVGLSHGHPVVVVMVPARNEGRLEGFVAVSLWARSLELVVRRNFAGAPAYSTIFNHQGLALDMVLGGPVSERLPETLRLADLVRRGSRVFRASDAQGGPAVFAVAEVVPGFLYALGVWPDSEDPMGEPSGLTVPLMFPVLMWLASLGVAFFSIYYLVLRHVRLLNRQVRRFALGQRVGWQDFAPGAPLELRELEGTFRKMARIIAREEAAREAALAEKTVLLKEIHHRVKNNLQLVASMINLQMRQVSDQRGRQVLEAIQQRVLGLATIHRALYEEDRLTRVRADRVLDEILNRITLSWGGDPGHGPNHGPSHGIVMTRRLEPVELTGERMVPLSLLLTEAATNAMKHVGRPAGGGRPWIEFALTVKDDGRVELRVMNALGTPVNPEQAEGGGATHLGLELIEAFAEQLDGVLETGPVEDPRGPAWALVVTFAGDPAG